MRVWHLYVGDPARALDKSTHIILRGRSFGRVGDWYILKDSDGRTAFSVAAYQVVTHDESADARPYASLASPVTIL